MLELRLERARSLHRLGELARAREAYEELAAREDRWPARAGLARRPTTS